MPWPVFPGHHGLLMEKIAAHAIVKKARAEGNILDDPDVSFQLGKILGQGTFGKVHEAMNTKTGEMVAIKRIELKSHKMKEQVRMAESEIALMTTLRHPHIVAIRGSMLDGDVFNIIMELVSGSSLADMTYCHAMHCVHRDIKGKNILLTTEGTVRICDFGSAKIREETIDKDAVSVTYSYTPLWVAPETLNAKMYNEKVDIWALGCVVIEMASGKDPWSEKRFQSSYQAIFHIGSSNEIPLIPASLSEEGKDFCRKCLTRDPEQRPSATELLKHSFVSSINVDAIVASDVQEDQVLAISRASSSASSASSASTASPAPAAGPQWAGAAAAVAAVSSQQEAAAANQMQVIRDMLDDSKKTTMQLAAPAVLVTMERKSLSALSIPAVAPVAAESKSSSGSSFSGSSSSAAESGQGSTPLTPSQVEDGNTMVSSHSAILPDASMEPAAVSVMQTLNQPVPAINADRPDSESAPSKTAHDQPDKNMSSKPFNVVYTFGTMTTGGCGGEAAPMKLDGSIDHKSPFASGDEQSRSESRVYSYQSADELNSSGSDMSLSHSVLQFSEGWKTFNIVPNV